MINRNRSTHLTGHHSVSGFHGAGHRMTGTRTEGRAGRHAEPRSGCEVLEVGIAARAGTADERWTRRTGSSEGRSARGWRPKRSRSRSGTIVGSGVVGRRGKTGVADALRRTGTGRRRTGGRGRRIILGRRGAGRRSALVGRGAGGRTGPGRRAPLKGRGALEARRRPGKRVRLTLCEVLGLRAGRRSLPGGGRVLQGDGQRDGARYAAVNACNTTHILVTYTYLVRMSSKTTDNLIARRNIHVRDNNGFN